MGWRLTARPPGVTPRLAGKKRSRCPAAISDLSPGLPGEGAPPQHNHHGPAPAGAVHGHWKTTTLIAALGIGGMRCSTVVDGAVNADGFEAFVEQVLVPQLRSGDVVVMDNRSSHKRARTRQLIEAAGAQVLYLPPYAPELNPIEMIFAKIKQVLRSLACRTRQAGRRCSRSSTRSPPATP